MRWSAGWHSWGILRRFPVTSILVEVPLVLMVSPRVVLVLAVLVVVLRLEMVFVTVEMLLFVAETVLDWIVFIVQLRVEMVLEHRVVVL